MSDQSTKEKIITHAHKLFAEKGYNGVSVREISQAAQVNVAAINYHFKNKENLYKQTLNSCISEMANDMRGLFEANKEVSPEEFSIIMFDYFIENSADLKSSFKMFVIDSEIYPDLPENNDEVIGPPGGTVLYEFLQLYKPNASHDDLIWAVRVIFTTVIHKALLFTSTCLMQSKKMHKTEKEDFNELIRRVVRVTINDI